jgi:hypothetical protein
MTFLGAFFIPVSLAFLWFRPKYLLPLLVFSSIFQAGSVVNSQIGSFEFGLPPFYFVAICIAFRYVLLALKDGRILPLGTGQTKGILTLLLMFWGWSVSSAWVMPRIFDGVQVYSPREGIDEQYLLQTPLHWSLSNLAQASFLTLDVVIILFALRTIRTEKQWNRLVKAFYVASLTVAAVGVWQYVAMREQWSFPYWILNNNPAYSQGSDQTLGDWQRINSTFSEPSGAGAFLAAAGSGLLASFLRGRRSLLHFLAMMAVLAVLLQTTSTTGFAAFVITLSLLLVYFNPLARKRVLSHSYARGWLAVFACVVPAGILLLSNASLLEAVSITTVDKSEGLSFVHRIASDGHAIELARDTYGLGVGLGSNRPSSLFTALLSTVGVLGTSLVIAMFYRIFRAFRGREEPAVFQMTLWALIALVIGAVVAGPDLTSPALWTMLAIVIVQLDLRSTGRTNATDGSAA